MSKTPIRFVAICQWCGKRGEIMQSFSGSLPFAFPRVMGKCTGHPSGKPNMPHNPKWEKM